MSRKFILGALFCLIIQQLPIQAQVAKTAEVKAFNGKPSLFVDGQVVTPDFYALTHAYGARWSWEEVPQRNLKNFCDIGIRLFQLDLYFEDIWHQGSDSLDIAKAQRQVRGLLDVCPDAGVVIRVHVNAPFWWNEANRDECTLYGDGPVDQRTYGPPFNNEDGDVDRPLRASLASMKWRKESGEKLVEFCKRMAATKEGQSVIGIHVSGGIYGEWHYWGFIGHDPDLGIPMTNYFRDWLKNKYKTIEALQKSWGTKDFSFENATVPGTDERNKTTDSIFRNPENEQRVIDYFTAQQQVVAEDIEYFCKIVKESWPRKLIVGVFYGYFHMTFCRQASGGHLFIERILNCPYIDYLSAPQSYWEETQNAGGSGNSRGVVESALLNGKLWLDELDNGHLAKPPAADAARSNGNFDTKYQPVASRSALLPLMRGTGFWYYDFGPRNSFGWWDHPTYLKEAKAIKEIFDRRLNMKFQPVADVLLVWDQESFYHVKNGWTPVAYNQLDHALEQLLRAGATTDNIYLFDLSKADLKRYKLVMFMSTYKMSESQRTFIKNKVASEGRTLVFNYLPGYTDGTKNDFGFVKDVTGFELKKVVCNDKWTIQVKNPDFSYQMEGPINPLVVINDSKAEVLSEFDGGKGVAMARKSLKDAKIVYSTVPINGTAVFRELFREAGCHIYNETADFTYANSGMIMIHTKDGGKRTIHLKNGKILNIDIPPFSTWLMDAENGTVIFK